MDTPFLTVSGLSFTYHSWTDEMNVPVLRGLDLILEEGEHALVLATPDSGKTTFSLACLGFIPKFYSGQLSGTVVLRGHNIDDVQPYDLLPEACYVSPDPSGMFVSTSVEDEVAFPLESFGLERSQMIKRVRQALEAWDMEGYAKVSPFELSGGEKKRLSLAIADAIDPAGLVLDEAFDDLDDTWRSALAERIAASSKSILCLSARFLPQFIDKFDKIYIMEEGRLQACTQQEAESRFTHGEGTGYMHKFEDQKQALSGYHLLASLHTEDVHELSVHGLSAIRKRRGDGGDRSFRLDVSDFRVRKGEIVRLMGANGSGKSSLARILCGLDGFECGQICFDGHSVDAFHLQAKVGYLFQNPDFQIFLPTVREEIAWGPLHTGMDRDDVDELVSQCCSLYHLQASETPSTMSFPDRKLLQAAVYQGLCRDFFILDELEGSLSYEAAYAVLGRLSATGAGIIVVTHDRAFARSLAVRTYVFSHGTLEAIP